MEATGALPSDIEAALDSYLNNGGIEFNPRPNWQGTLSGAGGIRVDAISTEAAVGDELAPDSFGGTDLTSKTETATAYIALTVGAVSHIPVMESSSTVVQENNGNSNDDEDLVVPIGALMDLSGDDADLDLTLSGFPTNAQQLVFGDLAGLLVSPTVDLGAGTIDISGPSSAV